MYKVIIVDDESWAVDHLVEKLNWNEYNFRIEKTFTDPIAALDYLKTTTADVMMLDIRMPNISGLELLEEIKYNYTNIEVVIISAYDEFSYARKAIQKGVFDYLLKPINEKEGNELLERLTRHIYERKNQNSKLNDIDVLEDIFSGKFDIKSLFDKYEQEYYRMIVMRNADNEFINAFIPSTMNKKILKIGISKYLIIINCTNNAEIPLCTQERMQIEKIGIKVGISEISDSRKESATIFKQADKAALDDFITRNCEVVYFSEPNTALLKESVESIIDIIKKGNTDLLDNAFARVQNAFRQKSMGMNGVEMFYNYIVLYLINNYDKGNKMDLSIMEYDQIYFRYASLNEMCFFLKECINDILSKETSEINHKNRQLENILKFINTNYMKHISLSDLSREFFLCSSYISVLFKKNMNKTLFEYINTLRMERAALLLLNTDKMVHEISNEVGYSDSFHFSKMFKKNFGTSPSEYREKGIKFM